MAPDLIDAKILETLQRDGRAPHSAIAEAVGLSQPSVHERVKKLEQGGAIKGYHAVLDPAALDLPVLAFIFVSFTTNTDSVWRAAVQLPNVLEAHHIAGEDCLLLKVRCRAPQEIEGVLERIWDSGPVASTRTTIVFSSYKETATLPLEGCSPESKADGA
jgi:Lrp/AsnC family leucine-responsive transcriptional regulator